MLLVWASGVARLGTCSTLLRVSPQLKCETVGVDNRFTGANRYEAAGNMTQLGAYTYDAENRLLTGGGVTYTYDGDATA